MDGNVSEPVAEAIVTVGFKTKGADVALAQVTGENGRHFSLALVGGYLTLLYSTKVRKKRVAGLTYVLITYFILWGLTFQLFDGNGYSD